MLRHARHRAGELEPPREGEGCLGVGEEGMAKKRKCKRSFDSCEPVVTNRLLLSRVAQVLWLILGVRHDSCCCFLLKQSMLFSHWHRKTSSFLAALQIKETRLTGQPRSHEWLTRQKQAMVGLVHFLSFLFLKWCLSFSTLFTPPPGGATSRQPGGKRQPLKLFPSLAMIPP